MYFSSLIDYVLADLQDVGSLEDENKSSLWSKRFKGYVDREERRMDEILKGISYNIDAQNTLVLVVGRARPDQVIILQLWPLEGTVVNFPAVYTSSNLSFATTCSGRRYSYEEQDPGTKFIG